MNEHAFNRLVERLRSHTPDLFPTGVWDEQLDQDIANLAVSQSEADAACFDAAYGMAVKAGLHLWNDSLPRSHVLAQDVWNETGSYWHGLMHRMEGDYENAAYWFKKAGSHPVFPRFQQAKAAILQARSLDHILSPELRRGMQQFHLQPAWDPHLFLDLVKQVVTLGQEEGAESLLTALQKQELVILLEFSYRHAFGGLLP